MKANLGSFKNECSLDVLVAFYVETDEVVTIEDTYFDVHKKTKTHRCEYSRTEFEPRNIEGTILKYSAENGEVKRFCFKKDDSRLREIETKIHKNS